jgi:predicted kinase
MASGKSTIAKKYRNFDSKMAWIKVDNFKDLFDHFEKEARPVVHGSANATLDFLLKNGYSVVMEGVFQNPVFIQQAVEIAQKYKISYKVFQLHVSLKTLQERDKIREGVKEGCRKPLEDEEIAQLYHKIENNTYPGAIKLNTEKLTIKESVKFIDSFFE